MNYLLDTNICSAFLKRPGRLAHRFVQYSGRLGVSVIWRSADLLTAGITVNPVDLMIAATALEHGFTVVTNNVRHFEVIPGLNLED